MLKEIIRILDVELKDDSTPYGGTSFAGETVRDYLSEYQESMLTELTLNKLNEDLICCGIEPVA